MSFNADNFSKLLRTAAVALDEAADMLDNVDVDDIAPPGPQYLLARLHIAQEIIELELPEFQRAALAGVADLLVPIERH